MNSNRIGKLYVIVICLNLRDRWIVPVDGLRLYCTCPVIPGNDKLCMTVLNTVPLMNVELQREETGVMR